MANMRLADWLQRRPDLSSSYKRPDEAVGMTTDLELALVESYARDVFTGAGRIFDLGCWYGATTAALARGLAGNTTATEHRRIHALDIFIWEAWMNPVASQVGLQARHEDSASFFAAVVKRLKPFESLVDLQAKDLISYDPGPGAIEFLFVDAMKSWPLADVIYRRYFPHLIPGTSVVVQQDFTWHHPVIATAHLMMWRLREQFPFLHSVPYSSSTVYGCRDVVNWESAPAISTDSFSLEDIHEAYEYSYACCGSERSVPLRAAKAGVLGERGYYQSALAQARQVFDHSHHLPLTAAADIKDWIHDSRTEAVPRPDAVGESSRASYDALMDYLTAVATRPAAGTPSA